MTAKEVAHVAIGKFNKKITDEIFLVIQEDSDLMLKYLRAVEREGLDATNKTIGRIIKESYGLINSDDREDSPLSVLIQSHQKFQ